MKNLTKCLVVFITFLGITALFHSCNEEQTSFSLDDIETTATITGNLSYSEGETYNNENVVEKVRPAAGKKVYVEINNADLYPQGRATGYSTFETTTDAYGNYEIEVPTVAIGQGVRASVKAENFTGRQTTLEVNEEGEIVSKEKEVIFTSPIQINSVKPNDFLVIDIKYNATERDPEEEPTPKANLSVKIGVGKLKNDEYYRYGLPYLIFQEGIKAAVTIAYEETINGNRVTVEKKYGGVTDTTGEFILEIPVVEKRGFMNVVLEVSSFRENNFLAPYYGELSYLTGTYQLYHRRDFVPSQKYDLVYYDEDTTATIQAVMVFNPDYGQAHNYYPGEHNWEGLLY